MWYWNQGNFEGLLEIAKVLDEDNNTRHLAEYCRLRECGLRQAAFLSLDKFLNIANALDRKTKIKVVDKVLELDFRVDGAHQFLTQPIWTQLLEPSLDEWLTDTPISSKALFWDGYYRRNNNSLRAVLDANPNDHLVRSLLIDRICIAEVEYAVHHINESVLLLDLEKIEELLAQGAELLISSPNRSACEAVELEWRELRRLIDDWKDFKRSGKSSFSLWCIEQGKKHAWL